MGHPSVEGESLVILIYYPDSARSALLNSDIENVARNKK